MIKNFYWSSGEVIVNYIVKIHDGENKTENKNKLELDLQQKYDEFVTEMIKTNNADINEQMIIDNKNKNLLISQKIEEQKKSETELAEKVQPSLDLFLCNYNKDDDDNSKRRKSKRIIELWKQRKPYLK